MKAFIFIPALAAVLVISVLTLSKWGDSMQQQEQILTELSQQVDLLKKQNVTLEGISCALETRR